MLVELEHRLHTVSAYLVVPLFALTNAGAALSGGAVREAFGARPTWAVVVDQAKVGILLGSALSAAVGVALILLVGQSSARSELPNKRETLACSERVVPPFAPCRVLSPSGF